MTGIQNRDIQATYFTIIRNSAYPSAAAFVVSMIILWHHMNLLPYLSPELRSDSTGGFNVENN